MNKLYLTLLVSCMLSCGKSTYYAYEYKDSINRHYSYCTLEVTKKNEVIYRANSYEYYEYPNKNIYVYMYSDNKASEINEKYISFAHHYTDLFYIRDIVNPEYNQSAINVFGESQRFIGFEKTKTDTIIGQNRKYFLEYAEKEPNLKVAGIKWFPEYMVKVDKIDYMKFGKSIQHMNLKNPKK